MSRSKFFDKIRVSTIERQVEDCYNEVISFYFKETNGDPIKFTYPYVCDELFMEEIMKSTECLKGNLSNQCRKQFVRMLNYQ